MLYAPASRLLELVPDAVMVPVLAAAYRAPLPLPPDCSVWPCGPSGTYKTALTALAQQHYGLSMDAQHLPGHWTSTGNALVAAAHMLDGALLVVDDYSPDVTVADARRRADAADRLMRGTANRAGRGRLRPDGTMRPDRPPRAQVLASAEDLPPAVESLLARVMVTSVTRGAVSLATLTAVQACAAAGVYALAMAGYVRHLAGRYDEHQDLPARLGTVRDELRDQARADGQHPRTSLNVASLALGWSVWLDYGTQAGAITPDEAEALQSRAWKALCEVGAEQKRYRRDADPVSVYLRSLHALIASGGAHIAAPDGGPPLEGAGRWGWSEDPAPRADLSPVWRPHGELVGWLHGDDIYLEPEAAYRAARRWAETSGRHLAPSARTLQRDMSERGLLASADHGHTTARRDVGGKRSRRVLNLTVTAFDGGDGQ